MLLKTTAVLAFGVAISTAAVAQSWPQKQVRFIVPFAAGGATDIPARMLAEKLSQAWGQPVIVENRPGAGGSVGAAEAARVTPDGYTLFFPSGSVMTANQHVYPKLSYDPEKDFVPITKVVSGPQVLVVAASSPHKSVADFIKAAKNNPKKMTFGHAGVGSQTHLAGENFVNAAKINAIAVAYKGDPASLVDVAGGSVDFAMTNLSSSMSFVQSGRLRALGVSSTTPVPQLPETPTIAKTLPGFENSGWFGLVAPTGTPSEVIQKVYQDAKKALDDTEMKARMFILGMTPVANSPEEMGKEMKAESARWARIVKERNIVVR